MALSDICSNALKEISGFAVPSTFYSNTTDPTAVLVVACANRAGKTLEKEYRWQELITEYTFTTTSGTATYALPSGFRAFANMTQWDRTNMWRMTQVPPTIYQYLKSGITVASNANKFFIVRGSLFTIYPTPTVSSETIAFDYYSKNSVLKQSDSSYVAAFTSDNDTSRLDEDLITLDVKWRFLAAKGLPFEAEYKERESMVETLQADNGGRTMIDLGRPAVWSGVSNGNMPESGFGD